MALTSGNLLDPNLSSITSNQPQIYGTVTNPNYQASLLSPEHDHLGTASHELVGAGTGSGSGATAASRRSVLIAVPEQDGDNISISSQSSYSTYSSSSSSTDSVLLSQNQNGHRNSKKYHNEYQSNPDEEPSARQLFWTYIALSPVLLSIWALFVALLLLLSSVDNESTIRLDRFASGAIGWVLAFASRTPIYTLFEKVLYLDPLSCEWLTLLSAGALEEVVRLGIIIFLGIGGDFGAVYWLGLGWAGVETLYYIGQSILYSQWLSDSDYRVVTNLSSSSTPTTNPQATNYGATGSNGSNIKDTEEHLSDIQDEIVPPREVRHLLGIDRPWWSLMGRTSSMMVHIGLCCWLGHSGWKLLIPAALTHGALNIVWGALMPEQHWSVPATSYGTLMVAMGVFLIGLALYGEIV